jgi:Histidine kinase-like ATPase domain
MMAPARHAAGQPGSLAAPQEIKLTAGDLPGVRQLTAGWAEQADLDAARAADFVIAVNEIATNAVLHGQLLAGWAWSWVWACRRCSFSALM